MSETLTKHVYEDRIVYKNERNEINEIHNINDEPAIVWEDGSKFWYKNGKRHQTKGPSAIYSNGNEFWFYEDINITEKVNQLMDKGHLSSDWKNWTEEDEFLFVLLVS